MAKKQPRKPTKPLYTREQKTQICKIVDMGITHDMHQEAVVSMLMEAIPKMTRQKALGAITWRKRSLAYSPTKIIDEEDTNRGVYILRMECAYALAMERGDSKTALTAAKELANVFGLLPKTDPGRTVRKIGTTNNVLFMAPPAGDLSELSLEQIQLGLGRHVVSPEQAQKLCDDSEGKYAEEDE